jgi:gamma-glutamyltranspeptidase/glutathione hydrolase
MSPTIALDGAAESPTSKVVLVVGGSGGPRIISATMQSALNVLLWDMGAEAAVASPRMHHQWIPDSLELESSVRGGEVEKTLTGYGHVISQRSAAAVQLIRVSRASGMRWDAASDPRKGGRPAGD